MPPELLLRALAASVLSCLLSEAVLVGTTCSSNLKRLKTCGARGGEAGGNYIGFFQEIVSFANTNTAKAFHRRNQFAFGNAAVMLLG